MKLSKIDPIPPGTNPFDRDLSRMGTRLGSNLMAMMMNHDSEPSSGLVLVNTATGERFAVDLGPAQPARIKHRSPSEVKDGLAGLAFMEGGGYISDWLRDVQRFEYSSATIPDCAAKLILESVGLDFRRFGNKDFVRYTQDGEVTGHDDRPCISFIYKHDFRWSIYTLNL